MVKIDLFLKYGLNDNIIFKLYFFINEFLDNKFNIISDNDETIKIIIINIITFMCIYLDDKNLILYFCHLLFYYFIILLFYYFSKS